MALAPAVKLEPVSLREIVGDGVRWASGTDRDTLGTGIDCFDRALEGGLPTGVLCELVAPSPSSGGQTMLLRLLEMARRKTVGGQEDLIEAIAIEMSDKTKP